MVPTPGAQRPVPVAVLPCPFPLSPLSPVFTDQQGLTSKASMIDGKEFDGAKAYKDSKVCNMLTMREFNKRYNGQSRVAFSSLYPVRIDHRGGERTNARTHERSLPDRSLAAGWGHFRRSLARLNA